MSATNSTPNLELPVFVGTDKPAWLTDWNGAMNKIDAAVGSTETDISGLESAVATQGQSITSLTNTVGQHTTSIQALTTATTHNAGDINTINSLIGNGTPTTEDKTIIGAINELYDDIHEPGGGVEADNVSYDNTSSGLTATNVQAAIDELAAGSPIPGGADLNFVTSGSFTATPASGVTTDWTEVKYQLNADKSIGKIYGGCVVHFSSASENAWNTVLTLTSSDMPTNASAYDILLGMDAMLTNSNTISGPCMYQLHFNTNGSVDIQVKPLSTVSQERILYIDMNPCIYILKDLGD